MNIPVKGGLNEVVEFCVSKYWDNLGTVDTEYSITFHGVEPSQSKS
jgi:hypothetical protein